MRLPWRMKFFLTLNYIPAPRNDEQKGFHQPSTFNLQPLILFPFRKSSRGERSAGFIQLRFNSFYFIVNHFKGI
jgi:hypothetical protein